MGQSTRTFSRNGHHPRPEAPVPSRQTRRFIENDYLAAIGDAVCLDDWRAVIRAAVESAKAGDARAREWLAHYLIGEGRPSLTDIAADEVEGRGAEEAIVDRVVSHQKERVLNELLSSDEYEEAREKLMGSARQAT